MLVMRKYWGVITVVKVKIKVGLAGSAVGSGGGHGWGREMSPNGREDLQR